MAALTADLQVESKGTIEHRAYPVKASETIYKGSIVSIDGNGAAVAGTDTASERCVGIALEKADNGSGLVGAINVLVGEGIFKLIASGMAQADLLTLCYITDSGAVADKDGPTNDVPAGIVTEFVSATSVWVDMGNRVVAPTA